ncbi:MAG: hypothetical protein IJV00_07660 [Clostridia bacterium]|nr:hypothetical protein [Clostridia bacterium]
MKDTKTNFITAYAAFLTSNFSRDQEGVIDYTENYRRVEMPFEKTVTKDIPSFERLCDTAAENGINKFLIFTGDALRYETHPEIAREGAWTKAELKKQLDRIRGLGMEPIPMLDFSAAHDIWLGEYSYMVSTPEYYKVCEDLIGEMCDFFGKPSLFWIGLGEENAEAQLKYDYSVVRGDLLFMHDMHFLFDVCRKNGARPWVCCDFYNDFPHLFAKTMPLEKALPKDVLVCDYAARYRYPTQSIISGVKRMPNLEALRDLTAAGYQATPMLSSWRNAWTPESIVDVMKIWATRENVAGFLRCPFIPVRYENLYKLLFEAKNTKKIIERWNGK